MSEIQYDPACIDCRRDAGKDIAGTSWQCAGHVRAERDFLRAKLAMKWTIEEQYEAACGDRDALLRMVETLRPRVSELEKDVRALTNERNAAITLAEQRGAAYDVTWREVESLRERIDKEEEERGRQFGLRVRAEEETERLISLVKEWLDGNARLGRPKSIADQRFLNGLNAEVRDSRQTEKAKDSEPPLRAENDRLRAENVELRGMLFLVGPCCEDFHHAKKDRHEFGEPCPIEARWRALAAPPEEK